MNHPKQNQWTLKKILDEGTASPFVARLILQTYYLRDSLIRDPNGKGKFNEVYSPLIDNFIELKDTFNNLKKLFEQHAMDVSNGLAARIEPNGNISVLKSIDSEYRSCVKDFFIKGEMVISTIPRIGKIFGVEVGFFFGKPDKFEDGSNRLKQEWGESAQIICSYVRDARNRWYEVFNKIRNDIEHRSLQFPPIDYTRELDNRIGVNFPMLPSGHGLVEKLQQLENHILELVEICVVFFFSTKLKPEMSIREIPLNEQDPIKVFRYRIYRKVGDQDVPYGSF